MTHLIRREILSAAYARAMKRGDRLGAKRVHDELRALVCDLLRRAA